MIETSRLAERKWGKQKPMYLCMPSMMMLLSQQQRDLGTQATAVLLPVNHSHMGLRAKATRKTLNSLLWVMAAYESAELMI